MRICACALVLLNLFACDAKRKRADQGGKEPHTSPDSGADAETGGVAPDAGGSACSLDCSGHGSCRESTCACDEGYAGPDCSDCAAGWQLDINSKVCAPPQCDGGPCVVRVESRIEQWGTAQSDQAYGVTTGEAGEAVVVGGAGAALEGQASLGGADLFVAGRYGGADAKKNWSRQWGTPQFDYAHGIVHDDAGHVFAVGDASGKLGDKHEGGADAVLSKWRPDHTLAWTSQWGTLGSDLPQAIARDANGNLWVVGWTDGDLQGKGAGVLDVFVSKLSADGVLLWSAQWGGAGDDAGFGIATDDTGHAYVTGALAKAGDRNIFCRKLSPEGKEVWSVDWGSTADDVGLDVAWSTKAGLWITGWTEGNLGGTGSGGAFLSRINPVDGNTLSTEQLGATQDDSGVSLALTLDGDLYLSGITMGSMLPDAHAGDEDVFVQKRDHAGLVLWTKQFGTSGFDRAESSISTTDGVLYVVGQTSGSFSGFKNRGSTDNFMLVIAP